MLRDWYHRVRMTSLFRLPPQSLFKHAEMSLELGDQLPQFVDLAAKRSPLVGLQFIAHFLASAWAFFLAWASTVRVFEGGGPYHGFVPDLIS